MEAGSTTNAAVIKLADAVGVSITQADISVSHVLPSRKKDDAAVGTTVIAKFVRRDVKSAIIKNKKKLKSMESYKSTYVNEDLTPLRSAMLRALRNDNAIKSCWSSEGRILCKLVVEGEEVTKSLESPDDLWKVGWDEERILKSGLFPKF